VNYSQQNRCPWRCLLLFDIRLQFDKNYKSGAKQVEECETVGRRSEGSAITASVATAASAQPVSRAIDQSAGVW